MLLQIYRFFLDFIIHHYHEPHWYSESPLGRLTCLLWTRSLGILPWSNLPPHLSGGFCRLSSVYVKISWTVPFFNDSSTLNTFYGNWKLYMDLYFFQYNELHSSFSHKPSLNWFKMTPKHWKLQLLFENTIWFGFQTWLKLKFLLVCFFLWYTNFSEIMNWFRWRLWY